jgi:NAD(P)-dependent dehydrogenase (short-subunit alcohol dehydrogenase family)
MASRERKCSNCNSTQGIGRAIAERLASDGASVAVNYGHSADSTQKVIIQSGESLPP